jgi:hypothetical protein
MFEELRLNSYGTCYHEVLLPPSTDYYLHSEEEVRMSLRNRQPPMKIII